MKADAKKPESQETDVHGPQHGDATGLNSENTGRCILREEEAEVVRPVVERAILLSGQNDRRVLGRALAPVVGPALRRSIGTVLKNILLGINRFFVLNFSVDGIRWRFEALRTGKPFRQVVQEHSLTSPVTQVFLIHRRTGLLIKQVRQESVDLHDGDMVSGMLTAIQDFVHDSFRQGGGGQLEVIRIGDVTVLLEQGPLAILAGIVNQGVTPQSLRKTFRRALEQISDEYHEELVNFRGDSSPFAEVEPVLNACLKTRIIAGEDRISPMTGIFLLALLVLAGYYGYFGWRQHHNWNNYVSRLERIPGIMVVDTGWHDFHRYIRGIRDPLAPDPEAMLLNAGFAPDEVAGDWKLYHSLAPELILKRVHRILKPPSTVRISLHNGIVTLQGSAPWNWVERAPAAIRHVCGVSQVKTDGVRLTGIDQKLAWNRYLAKIAELPGILVMRQGRGRDAFYISGMRDALAPDPIEILKASGLSTNMVVSHWEPFQALHPALILKRAARMLEPPGTVELELDGATLVLKGRAPHAWIKEFRLLSRGIAGISRFDTSRLTDTDLAEFKSLIPLFDKYVFYYMANNRDLWPGQETAFKDFLKTTALFEKTLKKIGGGYHIEIRGHVPAGGSRESDQMAGEEIARRFYNKLKNRRVNLSLFSIRSMGSEPAEAAKSGARKHEAHVSFKIEPDE